MHSSTNSVFVVSRLVSDCPLLLLLSIDRHHRAQAAVLESSSSTAQQQQQLVSAEERERRSIDAAMEAWLVSCAACEGSTTHGLGDSFGAWGGGLVARRGAKRGAKGGGRGPKAQ
jgi:hypothetical protein